MPLIEEIIQAAEKAGASDVHIAAGIPPKMRVNGNLLTMGFPKITAKDTLEILLEVMTEIQRERFEEAGEYDMAFSVSGLGRCRVNAYKQRGNVALALRLIGGHIPSAESLGLPETVINLYERRKGLILCAGAAGSGKTTTLAAMIDKMNSSREAHIITLEAPIEYLHQHKMSMINQREIGTDSSDYISALQTAMRADADIILIGEIGDAEMMEAAITAAETGHLVLSSMNATGIIDTVERFVSAFSLAKQKQICRRFANALEAIVFQQLVAAEGNRKRNAVFEVLDVDEKVRRLLRDGNFHQLVPDRHETIR